MPADLLSKLIADAPILAVLLIVLFKGGDKLDKLGEKFDKMTLAVKGLSSKVEMIGKLTDARLELHEERTNGTGRHSAVPAAAAATVVTRGSANGAVPGPHPSWPETPHDEDE
jgi:hypothetical protein